MPKAKESVKTKGKRKLDEGYDAEDDDDDDDDDDNDNSDDDDDDNTNKKQKKAKTSKDSDESSDESESDHYECDKTASNGKSPNIRICSWNVSGINAWVKKNGIKYLNEENADIICFQETKCSDEKIPKQIKSLKNYQHQYWISPHEKGGYSGVAVLAKDKPIDVKYGISVPEHDNDGRVITAEFPKFYLVNAYVPNSGRRLIRLEYRMKWDKDFKKYIKELNSKKPVILCGDLNVAHHEIDLANPKTNAKTAGFTKEERENFTKFLDNDFIDSFRVLNPSEKNCYTFWSYMKNARAKNVGWRLDYFVISKQLEKNLCDNQIRSKVMGSDHCPIVLFMAF